MFRQSCCWDYGCGFWHSQETQSSNQTSWSWLLQSLNVFKKAGLKLSIWMPGDIWPYFRRKVTINSHSLSFTIFFPIIWKEETVDAQTVNIHAPQHSCASCTQAWRQACICLWITSGKDTMHLEASQSSQRIPNSPFGSNKVEAALSSEGLELVSGAEEPSHLSWGLHNWKKLQFLLFKSSTKY